MTGQDRIGQEKTQALEANFNSTKTRAVHRQPGLRDSPPGTKNDTASVVRERHIKMLGNPPPPYVPIAYKVGGYTVGQTCA